MAFSRARLTDAEWNQRKPYIKQMIIEQNLSQKETIQRLNDGGFLVTKAQLEYKLKIWGFRKKAVKEKSGAIWQFIGHRIEKRKRQHKASDVFLNGQLVDPAKARKEINRHQPTFLDRLKQAGMSPKPPESTEVIIRTPRPTPVQSLWPSCLPWFQFQHSISLSFAVLQPREIMDHLPINFVAERKKRFEHPFSHAPGDSKIDNYSSLAIDLDIFMPETCKDENRGRTQLLLHGSAKEILIEHLNLVFYQISNDLGDHMISDDRWLLIVSLLEKSGITNMPFQLGDNTDTTILAVTEVLFQQAFECLGGEYHRQYGDEVFAEEQTVDLGLTMKEEKMANFPSWRIINWLLAWGQDPNTPILSRRPSGGKLLTPLQAAAEMACPQLIFLLLDAKSDPTLIFDEPEHFVTIIVRLKNISCTDKVRLLKRLVEYSACVGFFEGQRRASLMEAAIESLDFSFDVPESELLDMLIDSEARLFTKYRTPWLGWFSQTCSVLGLAARISVESVAKRCLLHLLGRISNLEPSLTPADLITPDVAILAASRGHNEVLELLRELDVDFTLCGHRGITALHVAAHYNHFKTCQRLLRLGVPVDGHLGLRHIPSPLHLAACKNNFEIVQLLYSHGADLTRGIELNEEAWSWPGNGRFLCDWRVNCPVAAIILNRNYQASEFFAQQGVMFPPWAAHPEAYQDNVPGPSAMRLALEMGADPNWTSESGHSALQIILKQSTDLSAADRIETALMLLNAGAALRGGEITDAVLLNDWHLIDRLFEMDQRLDRTKLSWAATSKGNRCVTKRLLEMNQFRTSQRHELLSVVRTATGNDCQHLIMQILKRCPDAYDAKVLCASVFFEHHGLRTVEYLLHYRPKFEDVHPLESLAIGIAAWRERGDLLDLLLAKFQKPSPAALPESIFLERGRYEPPTDYCIHGLLWTAEKKRLEGEEVNAVLASPLILALKSGDMLSRLLDHGFRPDRPTMSFAVSLGRDGPIQRLVRYPMLSPGFEGCAGPLSVAVRNGYIDIVKMLLDGNHCINEDNTQVFYGRSPLQQAIQCGNLYLIHMVLSAGADVNAPAAWYGGATALQVAAIKGYLGVSKILVDLGADVNAPRTAAEPDDNGRLAAAYGRTALEGAAEHGRIDTIQYLLSQGVQTHAEGRLSYLRAIRYAELEGRMVAAKLLKKWREWTADDDTWWDKLQSLPKYECEWFTEKDFEDQSGSESELARYSPGKASEGDGMQDLVVDDAPAAEVHTQDISVTENPLGGFISELEDLEMMTNDSFAFWPGL